MASDNTFKSKCKDNTARLCALLSSMVYSVSDPDPKKGYKSWERWATAVKEKVTSNPEDEHAETLSRLDLVHSSKDAVFLADPVTQTCYTVASGTRIRLNDLGTIARDIYNDGWHLISSWSNRASTLASEHKKAFGEKYSDWKHVATGHSAGGSDAEFLAKSKIVDVAHSFNAGGFGCPASPPTKGSRDGDVHAHKIGGDIISMFRLSGWLNCNTHCYSKNTQNWAHDVANFTEASQNKGKCPGGVSLAAVPCTIGMSFRGSVTVFSEVLQTFPHDVVAEVFIHVFSGKADPVFSLDPSDPRNPDGCWQTCFCRPESAMNTCIEYIMWRADWVLKQLSFGIVYDDDSGCQRELSQAELASKGLPDFQSSFEIHCRSTLSERSQYSRLWFSCDGVDIHSGNGGQSLKVGRVKMCVQARRMVKSPSGELKDAIVQDPNDADARFAAYLTKNYDRVAAVFPALSDLRKLQALHALAKFAYQDLGIPFEMLNQEWLEATRGAASLEYIRDRVPKLRNTKVQTGTRYLSKVEERGGQRIEAWKEERSEKTVVGGVNMRCEIKQLPQEVADKAFLAAGSLCALCVALESDKQIPKQLPELQKSDLVSPLFLPRCSYKGCDRHVLLPEDFRLWTKDTKSTSGKKPWCPAHHPLRCELSICRASCLVTVVGDQELCPAKYKGHMVHRCCLPRCQALPEVWPIGTRVMAHSLKALAFNGKFGTVEGWELDRLQVKLAGKSLNILPEKVVGCQSYTRAMTTVALNGQLVEVKGVSAKGIKVDLEGLGELELRADNLVPAGDFWTAGQEVLLVNCLLEGKLGKLVAVHADSVLVNVGQISHKARLNHLLGISVVLHSLTRVELNGQVGAIKKWDGQNKRVEVDVMLPGGDRRSVSVLPSKLGTFVT